MKFAAIKRSVTNDDREEEAEEYCIQLFETREHAALFLIDLYEFAHHENRDLCQPLMLDFFKNVATKDDALFQWEWKRRGNFRSYKIVPIGSDGKIEFYAQTKNLFKVKQCGDGNNVTFEIVKRTKK